MLCEYGCGQEAEYQFGNGKWCCSKSFRSCYGSRSKMIGIKQSEETIRKRFESRQGYTHSVETRQKISKSNKGKIISEEQRRQISIANTGAIRSDEFKKNIGLLHKGRKRSEETKRKMSISMTGKKLSEEHRKKLSESHKGHPGSNLGKPLSKKTKKKLSIYNKRPIEDWKQLYPLFSKIEKMRYEPGKEKEKAIQVHCKNHKCKNSKEQGGWFTPKYFQFYERIRSLETENGTGGAYFYCCEECKEECPIYKKKTSYLIKQDQINAGIIEDPWYDSAEYKIWRSYIFNLDNNKCVYCEKPAEHAHHILPQKTHPHLALDPENGIACCQECHYKYGHRDRECTTGYLSKLVCERIINIKTKHNIE